MTNDEKFMLEAIEQAKKALELDEVPIGAVVVKDGEIVGTGFNRRETGKNALYHAEIAAIDEACKKLGGWRLWQCDRIYLIPGWMDSRGARIESFAAHVMRVRRLPMEIKKGIDDDMVKWMSENDIHVLTQAEYENLEEKMRK